ncbi:MAG: N-acetylmuramoyl-L-alanine amidase [Lachnospiraceae bacterium]|nr:N-acetylmuramoyl-L-alanine amidase [Lachnospiraceae bacterium]
MKRRTKVLTAILLSAAMTLTSVGTGFAGEVPADPAAGTSETEVTMETGDTAAGETGEGVEDPEDTAGAAAEGTEGTETAQTGESLQNKESTGETTPEGAKNENAESQGAAAQDEEEPEEAATSSENGAETDTEQSGEVSDNVTAIPEADDAELEDTNNGIKTFMTWEYSHVYDGVAYSPGTYTVPKGAILMESSSYDDSKTVAGGDASTEAKTVTLKTITKVSENYTYYLYPKKTTPTAPNPDYTEKISVVITGRPVTYRSGTYTKEYDGKPLSQNSAVDAVLPWVVNGSLVNGETFGFEFDQTAVNYGDPSKETSVPNKFVISGNGTADVSNYAPTYEYGNLIVTTSRNNVNGLATPQNVKATVNNKGGIKLTWKKTKSYKANGKAGGKTSYDIYRYNDDGTWGEPIASDVKKTSYTDSTPKAGERLIYKIVAVGYDSAGKYGVCETPAYVRAIPKITSVSPYDGIKAVNVTFMGLGTENDEYVVEHWNVKKKGVRDQLTVNKYNSTYSKYEGKSRTISTNTFTDIGGPNVQVSVNKASFCFRVKAKETAVYDYGKKVVIPETKWSAAQKVKMVSVAPILKGERKDNGSFKLKWNKINKATGYLLEWSTDKDFSSINDVTKSIYVSKSEKTSTYNNREYTVDNVGFGVPYYCRVTAYQKKKNAGGYGTALGTSAVLVQYGRQKAVTDLKAEYFEDGNQKCDARLTWSDDADNVRGYYVQRWSYAYNSSTKQYDKETGYEVLQSYLSENKIKKYVNSVGDKIRDGELIKYRVQSVIFQGGRTGENYDGYVFSDPAEFYYMNPSEITFNKKKYTVPKGGTLTPAVKFKPKNMPTKADGLTQTEFKKVFLFNEKLEFALESDSLTNSEIKKYVTVATSTGKLTGIKGYKKTYIKLRASSPNDPSAVYATTTVCVAGEGSSNYDEKKEKSTTELTVCIDPGHGGKDDGATGNGIVEKDMNLKIAKLVGKYLKEKKVTVYYTRTDDSYVSLTDRTDYADDKDCNLFVSIHCNSSTDSGSNGTEVYYSVKSKYARPGLAREISSKVSGKLDTRNIGGKTRAGNDGDYYSVIRTSAAKGIPGLIVEHAFLSNGSDASKLKDDTRIEEAAKAEAEAIYKYWKE